MGNPQHDALLAQLEPICAEFEQKVIFIMLTYSNIHPALVPMMLASLTDIVVLAMIKRFGAEQSMTMISERINMGVLKMKECP
jgi:hypothetical protein